jgi:predicted 2-oxoglutarate/Fe(II)-dependent dioxygenase YbiX
MRVNLCRVGKLYTLDQVKEINTVIKNNIIKGNDGPAEGAIKSSQVKFINFLSLQRFLGPFVDFCYTANNANYGFDLFPLTANKILNYNLYNKDEEYTWHIDADFKSTIRDIKLTCLLNLSEEKYEGGDLFLFRDKEIKVEKFDPGCAVIFPSFLSHKVSKIISGKRATLAIWMWGPKFR